MDARVLVLAPTGKDAALTQSVLTRAGFACVCCSDLNELCDSLDDQVGAVVLTEESVTQSQEKQLADWLAGQPPWSDLPLLILARAGADSANVARAMQLLGNVTVLERPIRIAALVSAVRTALRARERQYQTRNYLAERETAASDSVRRSDQVRRLAEILPRIHAAADVRSVLGVLAGEARRLIESHQSVASMKTDSDWQNAIDAVSLSDKYAKWRDYVAPRDGSGIYSLVCATNQPMRMTQAQLESHTGYKSFGAEKMKHPPLRGWLAAPIVQSDGHNLGLIQLSDKCDGEFTADDEAVLVQLAQMASVAIENARLVHDLREADQRKDEFLAILAHELRNPLAPIRNSLHLLRLTKIEDPTVSRVGDMIERQVNHMVRLVDDLLEVSRITRGKIELRKEFTSISTVVHSAVETSRPLIEAGNHELTVSVPDEDVALEIDPIRITQVIANLLNNAAKYTDPGGKISLTIESKDEWLSVSVRDNGTGIAPEMLPRVFDLFTQIQGETDRARGGLGIGLTLVRSLVEMHGGRVSADSKGHGQGSEFVVRLPLISADRHAAVKPVETADEVVAQRRVLVVDDNHDAADSLAMLLAALGLDTHVVYNGPDALAAMQSYRPTVVLLDIGMPGMDGHEVTRRIRSQNEFDNVALVAVTGWGQEEDRRRSRASGFDHHLTKPPDVGTLKTVLQNLDKAA